jgi:hypothetical protein
VPEQGCRLRRAVAVRGPDLFSSPRPPLKRTILGPAHHPRSRSRRARRTPAALWAAWAVPRACTIRCRRDSGNPVSPRAAHVVRAAQPRRPTRRLAEMANTVADRRRSVLFYLFLRRGPSIAGGASSSRAGRAPMARFSTSART